MADRWDENKHPRDNDGKFASKGEVDYAKEYADRVKEQVAKDQGLYEKAKEVGNTTKNPKPLILPKKEYGELCSSIRTKYADKIPSRGTHYFDKHCYLFTYNKKTYQFLFVGKLEIEALKTWLEDWGD